MTAAHTIFSGSDLTAGDEWPVRDPCGSAVSLDGNNYACVVSASNPSIEDLTIRQPLSRVSEPLDENRCLRDDKVRRWSLNNTARQKSLCSPSQIRESCHWFEWERLHLRQWRRNSKALVSAIP